MKFSHLELLKSIKLHPIFYIFLLQPYKESTVPNKVQVPSLSIESDIKKEFQVLVILNFYIYHQRLEYLNMHWHSYEISEWSRKPVVNLVNTFDMVHEIHCHYPNKPHLQGGTCRTCSLQRVDVTDVICSNTNSILKTNIKYWIERPSQMEVSQEAT